MLFGSLLVVCPNHLNIFCLFWVMIFCWPVLLTCTLTGWWSCLASKFWISFFGIVCGILRPSRNLFEYWNYFAVVYFSFTHQADVGVFPYIIYLLKWDGCVLESASDILWCCIAFIDDDTFKICENSNFSLWFMVNSHYSMWLN